MWSPVQRPPLGYLNTKHCLEIQVTLTDELRDMPPPSHSWMPLLIEDMLWEARAGLTEAVVISPSRVILFYRRCSMGEGLRADEARDAAFFLTGAGMWGVKLAYLTTNPMTIQEAKRAIAQAVLDNRVKARGPGCSWVNPLAQQPFKFNTQRIFPPNDVSRDYGSDDQQTPQWPFRGWGHNRRWRDQQPWSPQFPSPFPDHSFKSDRSSLSMVSSMSSQSNCLDRSRCSRWGRRHWEETCMKINLPIFKDRDTKDAVTYQSWRRDLTVYWCAGCRDHTLLPYAIRLLQGYPGELVWSSGMDIMQDDVLMILDEH